MAIPSAAQSSFLALVILSASNIRSHSETLSYDKDTEYSVEQRADGLALVVHYSRYQFIPDTSAVATACKGALSNVARRVAGNRALQIHPSHQQISIERNGFTGITSCTARALLKPPSAPLDEKVKAFGRDVQVNAATRSAVTCSTTAAIIFSATNPDGAQVIGQAACDKCRVEWDKLISVYSAQSRKYDLSISTTEATNINRQACLKSATNAVIESRARKALGAPTTPARPTVPTKPPKGTSI